MCARWLCLSAAPNVALGAPVVFQWPSSTSPGSRCTDGLSLVDSNLCESASGRGWMRIQLPAFTLIHEIRLHNRADAGRSLLNGFSLFVTSDPVPAAVLASRGVANASESSGFAYLDASDHATDTAPFIINVTSTQLKQRTGRYVTLLLPTAAVISIRELQVFGVPARCQETNMHTAATLPQPDAATGSWTALEKPTTHTDFVDAYLFVLCAQLTSACLPAVWTSAPSRRAISARWANTPAALVRPRAQIAPSGNSQRWRAAARAPNARRGASPTRLKLLRARRVRPEASPLADPLHALRAPLESSLRRHRRRFAQIAPPAVSPPLRVRLRVPAAPSAASRLTPAPSCAARVRLAAFPPPRAAPTAPPAPPAASP